MQLRLIMMAWVGGVCGACLPQPQDGGDLVDSGDSAAPGASGSATGTSSPGFTSAAEPTAGATDTSPPGEPTSGGGLDTGDTGDTADTDPGEPVYPDCVDRGEASATFSVTIDGTNEIFGTWDSSFGDINGPCEVVIQDVAAGLLSLVCEDLEGVVRTVDLEFDSEPAVGFSLAEGPVDLFFEYIWDRDELEAEPETEGSSFVLSQGGVVLMAGINGEYSEWEEYALPNTVMWSTEGALCGLGTLGSCVGTERRRGTFGVDGHSVQLFDGHSAALGDELIVVVDRLEGSRVNPNADDPTGDPCCCHGPPSFVNPRFLIGSPI